MLLKCFNENKIKENFSLDYFQKEMIILSLTFHQMNSQVKKLLQRFCNRLRYYTNTLYIAYICNIVLGLCYSLPYLDCLKLLVFCHFWFLNCFINILFLIFWMSKFSKNRLVWIKTCSLFLYKAYKTFLLDIFWLWIIIIFFYTRHRCYNVVCMSAWW